MVLVAELKASSFTKLRPEDDICRQHDDSVASTGTKQGCGYRKMRSTSNVFSLIPSNAPSFTLHPALRSSPSFILPFPSSVRLDSVAITLSDGMLGLARLLTLVKQY